ncbi:protoglobin domain-containing protein [Enterovibrio nigricans]|uniref:Protoglobin n=1 Tax=Enterovibrio nigricans DSM 22720 TaxID=1121868 RepID=A0A1T4VG18_9GAMM|nr:protoglobin domain-containing protein [Enterovibrio nigricans]SKA63843.1 Protoglobin [Enterovibrio nigricans DSM 22720]
MKRAVYAIFSISILLGCTTTVSAGSGGEGVPGYDADSKSLETSPVSQEEFALLQKTIFFGPDDVEALRQAQKILKPQISEILDTWYGYVGANPHLLYYFSNKDTREANGEYLSRVRARFEQWILDLTSANYDQQWLNYQHEIAKRHHRVGKNRADDVNAVYHIDYRYMVAFIYPITTTIKPFLAKGDVSQKEADAMYEAWRKAVILSVVLWTHPYIKDGDF